MTEADNCELSTYGQMADVLSSLGFLVREKRRERRQSMRSAAAQSGVETASTFARFEAGAGISLKTAIALLRWLDQPPAPSDPEEES